MKYIAQDNLVDILEFLGSDVASSAIDVDPMLLVQRIRSADSRFNLNAYLLDGISLARRHRRLSDSLAYQVMVKLRDIGAWYYETFSINLNAVL